MSCQVGGWAVIDYSDEGEEIVFPIENQRLKKHEIIPIDLFEIFKKEIYSFGAEITIVASVGKDEVVEKLVAHNTRAQVEYYHSLSPDDYRAKISVDNPYNFELKWSESESVRYVKLDGSELFSFKFDPDYNPFFSIFIAPKLYPKSGEDTIDFNSTEPISFYLIFGDSKMLHHHEHIPKDLISLLLQVGDPIYYLSKNVEDESSINLSKVVVANDNQSLKKSQYATHLDSKFYFKSSKPELNDVESANDDLKLHSSMVFYLPNESVKTFNKNLVEAPVHWVQNSFHRPLTQKGLLLKNVLRSHLINETTKFNGAKIYAPLTSVANSSGTGKSKVCTELLYGILGLYFIFRESKDVSENSYPRENTLSARFKLFCNSAPVDDIPGDIMKDTNVSRCLLFLEIAIDNYLKKFKEFKNKGVPIHEIIAAFAFEQIHGNLFDDLVTEADTDDIKKKLSNGNLNFIDIGIRIATMIKKFFDENASSFSNIRDPFLILFDEANVFRMDQKANRLSGISILRRALHCIHHEAKLMCVAIGTKSDIIQFHPDVNADSIRISSRVDILSPFTPGLNWDVIWDFPRSGVDNSEEVYDLTKLKIDEKFICNTRYSQFLCSLGRPIWSSLAPSTALSIAEVKLKNNSLTSGEAYLAIWAIRAGINLVPYHEIPQIMVKSLMAINLFANKSGKKLLVSYPSDPVLSIAAKSVILNQPDGKEQLFTNLKKFCNSGAVDLGTMAESISSMLLALAVDYADEYSNTFDAPITGLGQLNNPLHYITEVQTDEDLLPASEHVPSSFVEFAKTYTVKSFLKSLYGDDFMGKFENMGTVSDDLLNNGLVNVTHFVRLNNKFGWKGETGNPLPKNEIVYEGNQSAQRGIMNVIDSALLREGLMRQCAFLLPENYFGLDAAIPVLIKNKTTDNGEPFYTYIGIQIKTGETNFDLKKVDAAMHKMAPGAHFIHCPKHAKPEKVKGHDCTVGCSYLKDICTDHLVLFMVVGREVSLCKVDGEPAILKPSSRQSTVDQNKFYKLDNDGALFAGKWNIKFNSASRGELVENQFGAIVSFGIKPLDFLTRHKFNIDIINDILIDGLNVFESLDSGNDRNWFAKNCKAYSFLYPDANNELCSRRGFKPLPKLVSSPELPSVNPDPRKDEKLLHGLELIEKPDGGKTPSFLLNHKADKKNILKSLRSLNLEGQEAQEARVEQNSSKEKTKNTRRSSHPNIVEELKRIFKKKKKN